MKEDKIRSFRINLNKFGLVVALIRPDLSIHGIDGNALVAVVRHGSKKNVIQYHREMV